MKEDSKHKNCGEVRWLGSLRVIDNITIRYMTHNFTFYSPFIETVPFSRYSKLFVENHNFFLPDIYLAPQLWVTLLEFGIRKLEYLEYDTVFFEG